MRERICKLFFKNFLPFSYLRGAGPERGVRFLNTKGIQQENEKVRGRIVLQIEICYSEKRISVSFSRKKED